MLNILKVLENRTSYFFGFFIVLVLFVAFEARSEKEERPQAPFLEEGDSEEKELSYAEKLRLEYEKKAEEILTQKIPESKKLERIEALRESYIKKLHSQVHR